MGWITQRLGYGKYGTVDGDNPDSPPQVTVNGTIQFNPQLTQNFGRILNNQFNDNEEIRCDKPQDYNNGFEYVAVASSGSRTSDLVWFCIRFTWINNRKIRVQYQSDISWDTRTLGWN